MYYRFLIIMYLMLSTFAAHAKRPIKNFDGVTPFLKYTDEEVPNPDSSKKFDVNSIIENTNIKKGLHPFFIIGYFSSGSLLKERFTKKDIIQIIKKSISLKDMKKFSHFYTPIYDMHRGNSPWSLNCFFSFFYDYKKADIKVHPSFFIGTLESARCHITKSEAKRLYDFYFEYLKDHPWRSEFIEGPDNTYIDVNFMKTSSDFKIDKNKYYYSDIELATFLRSLRDKRILIPEKIAIIKFVRMHDCLRQQHAPGYRAYESSYSIALDKTDRLAIEKKLKKSIETYLKCKKKNH